MSGKIVQSTNLDSIRIEVLGEGRAVTIPATLLLAADRVMRHCLMSDANRLTIYPADEQQWHGCLGTLAVNGASPWDCIRLLADKLEGM